MATVKHALSGKSPATDTAAEKTTAGTGRGLSFQRYFTDGKKSPFDVVEWEKRTALIGNEKGVTIFRQEDVKCQRAGRKRRQISSPANISTESPGRRSARDR